VSGFCLSLGGACQGDKLFQVGVCEVLLIGRLRGNSRFMIFDKGRRVSERDTGQAAIFLAMQHYAEESQQCQYFAYSWWGLPGQKLWARRLQGTACWQNSRDFSFDKIFNTGGGGGDWALSSDSVGFTTQISKFGTTLHQNALKHSSRIYSPIQLICETQRKSHHTQDHGKSKFLSRKRYRKL
jgi:hypothetical protein